MSLILETQGFEEVAELLASIDIPGQLGAGIADITGGMTRFAASITPVDTGAMRGAWIGRAQGLAGAVHVDPAAINPRSGAPVTDYAGFVSDRLGILDAVMREGERLAVAVLEEMQWVPR